MQQIRSANLFRFGICLMIIGSMSGVVPPPKAAATEPTLRFAFYDNSEQQEPVVYADDVTVTEGNSSEDAQIFHIYVYVAERVSFDLPVNYQTADGSATAGQDYSSQQGQVVIERGNNRADFEIPIIADEREEGDELFYIDLSLPEKGSLGTQRVYATIREDDWNLAQWAIRYDYPPGADDGGSDLAIDPFGDLLVFGGSSAGGNYYKRIIKYSSSGKMLWERSRSYEARGAVDYLGNIYLAGQNDSDQIAVAKYSREGDLDWEYWTDGPNRKGGHLHDIVIDPNGSVVVSGGFIVDGKGDSTIVGSLVMKFDPEGNLLWSQTYGTSEEEWGSATRVDTDRGGNIIVGKQSITPGSKSLMVLKYSPSGELLWATRYQYSGTASSAPIYDMRVSPSGHVYLAGSIYRQADSDIALVLKFSPNGELDWEIAAFEGIARALDFDQAGNIYVIGPEEYKLIKITPAGDMPWGMNPDLSPADISVSPTGKIYLTGGFHSDDTGADYATLCLDLNGNILWREYNNGTGVPPIGYELAWAITLDSAENVYVTGNSNDDMATIKYGLPKHALLGIPDGVVIEGDNDIRQMRLWVQLDAAQDYDISVSYETIGGSAQPGADYQETGGTITFPAGSVEALVEIPVLNDDEQEDDETFQVKLSGPSAGGFTDSIAVGTILDEGTRFLWLPAVVLEY